MDTQKYIVKHSGASLVVLEDGKIQIYELDKQPEWRVGRLVPNMSQKPDILFQSQIVSREHGWIRNIEGQWYYIDNPRNCNGTFYNAAMIPRSSNAQKYSAVNLESGDLLRIDYKDLNTPSAHGVLMFFTKAPVAGEWITYQLSNQNTVIGRNSNCEIVETLPYISSIHAKISYADGRYYLTDCKSAAGTFLNGRKVENSAALREKDVISICDCVYFFSHRSLIYVKRNYQKEQESLCTTMPLKRPIILSANIKSKKVENGKELLRDIQLKIRAGTLVAVLGTAGAGKSILMGCLSGSDSKNVEGNIVYKGIDLVKNAEQIKCLIGYVPQEKVIRPELTPKTTFIEAARLRLPAEMSNIQIKKRVDTVLKLLNMEKVKDTLNSKLSGGEQTRVNIGIELVANRETYFLDEPDQGLSPNLRTQLYSILQNLAHNQGKTVIAIIHDVSCIEMFDQVIFLVKANNVGRLAFSGTPQEICAHFGVPAEKVYKLLEDNPNKYVEG